MTSALKKKLLLSLNRPIRPQDVFATSLYTGNGGTQTITNGLDLAGKGGLVWVKNRGEGVNNLLTDTIRGPANQLLSDQTNAEASYANQVTGFSSNGFALGPDTIAFSNRTGRTYVAWSFRRAKKFFDAVTYTGNGVAGRQIPHGLGDVPGMIVVKARGAATSSNGWLVYHRALSPAKDRYLVLNTTDAQYSDTPNIWGASGPTTTAFNAERHNDNGVQYVAYLFAHNPDLIQCVGFETDGAGNASISHGWSNGTQFALLKPTSIAGDWEIFDRARSPNWTTDLRLRPNLSNAEDTANRISESGGVMTFTGLTSSPRYVSMLIRSPT